MELLTMSCTCNYRIEYNYHDFIENINLATKPFGPTNGEYYNSPFMAPYDFKIADAGATLKPAEKSFEDNSEDCFVLVYVYSIDGRLIRVFDNRRELEEYQFGNNRVSSQLNGLYFIAFHYCNGLVETKKYLFIN